MHEAHGRDNRRSGPDVCAGVFGVARTDLECARRLYLQLGMTRGAALSLHNLASLDTRCGDIIGALGRSQSARTEFQSVGLDLGVLDLDCCDALLTAGLAREALQRATSATEELRANGNSCSRCPRLNSWRPLPVCSARTRSEPYAGRRPWSTTFGPLVVPARQDLAELVRLRCLPPDGTTLDAARGLLVRLDVVGVSSACCRHVCSLPTCSFDRADSLRLAHRSPSCRHDGSRRIFGSACATSQRASLTRRNHNKACTRWTASVDRASSIDTRVASLRPRSVGV